MKSNIALIGFMGTGKTAVGRALAKRLGKKFIELDLLIEQRAGKSIPEIFQNEGEIAFREREIEATKKVAKDTDAVIACGGGIVLNKINIDRLQESSRTIYLTASPDVILKRTLRRKNERPLLNVPDPATRVRELLEFRTPFYERAADITINTSQLGINAIAKQIIEKLEEDESFDF